MKKIRKLLEKQSKLTNVIVLFVGLVFVLSTKFFEMSEVYDSVCLSVGCSLIATSIATFLTSFYIIKNNEIKEMINEWRLRSIYKTKTEMNEASNKYLEEAKKHIDIIAIGMSNFISYKGEVLEKKAIEGVEIRIISCNNTEMLNQREKDETIGGDGEVIGTMINEVESLTKWVENIKNKNGNISIKYHSTYPGFSYLRLDEHIFFGPNLPLYKSQINFALEFDKNGDGGAYFNKYFNKLWEDVCTESIKI